MSDSVISSYAKSSNINIFPLTVDRPNHYNGQVLSEQNICMLIQHLTDKPRFVISAELVEANGKITINNIKFMFDGHYIELSDTTLLAAQNLWVSLNQAGADKGFIYIDGKDEGSTSAESADSTFSGINFYVSAPNGIDAFQLIANSSIPVENYLRHTRINGGTV